MPIISPKYHGVQSLDRFLNSEKGFTPIIVIFALTLLVGAGAMSSQIKTTTEFPQNTQVASILGEDAEYSLSEAEKEELARLEEEKRKYKEELIRQELEKKEERKKNEEAYLKEKELKKEELMKKEEKLKLEVRSKELKKRVAELRAMAEKNRSPKPTPVAEKSESKEIEELETQLRLLEKELKEKDQKVEYEQQIGDLKMKYIYEKGKLVVKAQAENGAEIEVDDPQVNLIKAQLENQLKENGIEIGTSSSNLVIGKNKIKAKTNFPLSIDPETNQLIVTTPKGQKIVTVLPDQAIQNMLSKKVLSEVNLAETDDKATEESEIELENREDQVVYKIKGKKEHKLIGFIPVKTDTTAYVSAENGEVVAKDESLLSKLIDFIST
jgi:hypothetical protein